MIDQTERRNELSDPIRRLHRMMEIRAVEDTIQTLFNDGYVRGSTHLCIGQEAVAVGLASVTEPTDSFCCTYRGHGAALALGVAPAQVIGEICGRTIGCAEGVGGSMHMVGVDVGLFPTSAIVGGGLPIAVGAALTAKTLRSGRVAVAVFGDGACNIGAFHEALNLAAIWKLPVIFVIENNLYGEYSRIELTTPVADLAVRAEAYAMRGEVVDGQDVDAVIASATAAVHRARSGEGPTLLEMKTYRYSGHSKSDPATYRPAGELDAWLRRDPIDILGKRLIADDHATEASIAALEREARTEVAAAVAEVLASPEPAHEAMFDHISASRALT